MATNGEPPAAEPAPPAPAAEPSTEPAPVAPAPEEPAKATEEPPAAPAAPATNGDKKATPVVFVHGLWMHTSSWTPWVDLFKSLGYEPLNPGWPGDGDTVADQREHPEKVANIGVGEAADHYAKFIADLPSKPILIGHSFGGLIVQILLGKGLALGAIAIDPAQFKGILTVPIVQLKGILPIIRSPGNKKKAFMPDKKGYHAGFANAVSEEESNEIHDKYVIPSPNRPLFQLTVANFYPGTPCAVNTKAERGPLLLTAGGKDLTVPEVLVHGAYKQYAHNKSVTEIKVWPEKGHSLASDSGWKDVADFALEFLAKNGLGP
jgi:pimeloyl-ACP methyl ester carboxylesterase